MDNRPVMWLPVPMLLVMLVASCQAKSVVLPKPALTYVAGPSQLTLLHNQQSYRDFHFEPRRFRNKANRKFAYIAENQFRAERRHPNGTVEGFYGFIGADGKPVRVKYSSVDEQGFQANSELIPEEFTTDETTEFPEVAPPSGAENAAPSDSISLLPATGAVVSADKDSVSVDAANVHEFSSAESRAKREDRPLTVNGRINRRLVRLKSRDQPDVIYAEPLTVRSHFTVQ